MSQAAAESPSVPRKINLQILRTALPWCLLIGFLFVFESVAQAQNPAAARLMREAERLGDNNEWERMLEELSLLVRQFPDDRLAPRALLRIVEIHKSGGDAASTRTAVKQLVESYPRTPEAAEAFVLDGEMKLTSARGVNDLEDVRAIFRRVPILYGREDFPRLATRSRARIRAGEISLQLGDLEDAAATFVAAIEDEPVTAWVGRAQLRLAETLLRGGQWTSAAEILQRISRSLDESSTEDDRLRAARLLSLVDRRMLRSAVGEPSWRPAQRFSTTGVQLSQPVAVDAAEDGRLLVVDRRANLIVMLGRNGEKIQSQLVKDAERPSWSRGLHPFLVTDDSIQIPFESVRTTFLEPKVGKENTLRGMKVAERDAFGDWLILAKSYDGILSFTSRRQGQELLSGGSLQVVDLASAPTGETYYLDAKSKTVFRLGFDRRPKGRVAKASWQKPAALDVDVLGNVYVLDRGARRIDVFDSQGHRIGAMGPDLGGGIELRSPQDLSVDGEGRLFIADSKLPFLVVIE